MTYGRTTGSRPGHSRKYGAQTEENCGTGTGIHARKSRYPPYADLVSKRSQPIVACRTVATLLARQGTACRKTCSVCAVA